MLKSVRRSDILESHVSEENKNIQLVHKGRKRCSFSYVYTLSQLHLREFLLKGMLESGAQKNVSAIIQTINT